MKTTICIILATLSTIASAQTMSGADKALLIPKLGSCTSIQANYFEIDADNKEGMYHAGDTDNLTDVLGLELGRAKAGELIGDTRNIKAELIQHKNKSCSLQLTYNR
jgi:hypothetical protein